jgi:hypothetical protein
MFPTKSDVDILRPAFVRSIVYNVLKDCARLERLDRPYLVTINNECLDVGGGWQGWDVAIRKIADRPRPPFAVCVGNEFDLFWQNNRNDVTPDFAADLIRRAARILRPKGIKTVATSVASAVWPEYLQRMADLCWDDVDWFDIHPYGQRPSGWGSPGWMFGDLVKAMSLARHIASKPVMCSEIGVKVGDAGGEDQVAWWMQAAAQTLLDLGPEICPAAAWFAWHDANGAPYERGSQAFGLLREDNSRRPAWFKFQQLPSHPIEEMPVFTVGQGVKDLMATRGDSPATDEIYHPIGASAGHHQYSETFGKSGARYVYIFSTNQVKIYLPEA